jgi:hypothetical protein
MIANFSFEKRRLLFAQNTNMANFLLSATDFDSPIHNNIKEQKHTKVPPPITAKFFERIGRKSIGDEGRVVFSEFLSEHPQLSGFK